MKFLVVLLALIVAAFAAPQFGKFIEVKPLLFNLCRLKEEK